MNKGKQEGITLIALIITIIVMLILVAVAVRTTVTSGLFGHASDATKGWGEAQEEEGNIGNDGITINGIKYNSMDEYLKRLNRNDEEKSYSFIGIEFVKKCTDVPVNIDVSNVTFTDDVGSVEFSDDGNIVLLFRIGASGSAGDEYNITCDGAVYLGGDPLTGTIQEKGFAVVYVTKTYNIYDVENGHIEITTVRTPGKNGESNTSSTETVPVVER